MKKLILALFSLLLIVSISAVATDINGTCDNGISWSVSDGTLTVSGEGEVPNYTRSDTAPWTQYRNEITSIVVEDGITSLGSYCFFNLNNATSISIADSVKYLGLQFIRGTSIEEVSTNAETVVINAFGRADSLKTVRLTESFKNPLGNIFYSETVTIIAPESSYAHRYAELFNSKFKTDATVTYESDGTQASVPVVSLASMGDSVFGAFYKKSDSSWEMVVNGSGKMKNFPYVSPKNELKDYTFCPTYYLAKNNDETKITSIKMLDGVTTVGNYAFYKCTKATGVELPEGITSVGQGAFRGCTRLTSITLPEGVLKIEANAFNGCTNLTSVNIPDSVTEIGKDIFIKCNTDNLTVDTENKMAISYLKESYPELAPEEEITEDINYETAILLCVNCSAPIIVDGKVSAEHFYASIMIDNKTKSVELNKANAIDGMNCDEAYSTYKLKDKNNDGYVDYAHLLVAYTVNSDGLYTLYTNPESTDETVILDKGATITYSFTDSCYEINGRKVKTDENSIIYYTFNATSTVETLGCYTKDSLPKYFGEAVSSQPVYLKDNQDGTYTLISTMVSGELEKDTDIFTETVHRVVGTEHFGYNGAPKSGKEDIIRLEGVDALVNLEDLGLEDYIGNSDALIGLDVLVITKNNEIINTTVLGSVKLAEVSSVGKDDLGFAITDEVNIDGTVYADAKNSDTLFANLKTLVYDDGVVIAIYPFAIATENNCRTSELEYPHVALVMDHEGDGVIDAIAIKYYTLGEVTAVKNVKATTKTEAYTEYTLEGGAKLTSDKIADGKTLAKGDVFVYATLNGTTYVDAVIEPINAKPVKLTDYEITLEGVKTPFKYVDGGNYLKDVAEVTFNAAALFDKDAIPLNYYVYNGYVVRCSIPLIVPTSYNLAILLYVDKATDPIIVDNKVVVNYPAVLMIDGKTERVNLNSADAIDGARATDVIYSGNYALSDKNGDGFVDYAYLLVNYVVNKDGTYTLSTTAENISADAEKPSQTIGDTVIVAAGSEITVNAKTALYKIGDYTFELDENSVLYYTIPQDENDEDNNSKTLANYTAANIVKGFDAATTAQLTYLRRIDDSTFVLVATVLTGEIEVDVAESEKTYKNDANKIFYANQTANTVGVDGKGYYEHFFMDWATFADAPASVNAATDIADATKTVAGKFYGWDETNERYVKVTEDNSDAVQLGTITCIDATRGLIYIDGVAFVEDGKIVNFANGIKLGDAKILATAKANDYKTMVTYLDLAKIAEIAENAEKTLDVAVGVSYDEEGELQIAWIIVDNYIYSADANNGEGGYIMTTDIIESLRGYDW